MPTFAPAGWRWVEALGYDDENGTWWAIANGGEMGGLFLSARDPQQRYGALSLHVEVKFDSVGAAPVVIAEGRIVAERDGDRAGLARSAIEQLVALGGSTRYAEIKALIDGFVGDVARGHASPSRNRHEDIFRALPFRTARDLAAETPEDTQWVVRGLLARGAVTELAAKIKAGKTMFQLHMIAAILGGRPFLGLPTRRTPVILLSEERPPTIRAALARAGLLETPDLHILTRHDRRDMPWPEVVRAACEHAQAVGAAALFVDTLTRWANLHGDDENSAGVAGEAMEPLETAAAMGFAVFETRHDRKSGGEIGDSARGSSAFGGAADVLLALRRATSEGHPTRRTLLGVGRFDGTPEELTIELQDSGYVALGDARDVECEEAIARLCDILPGPDGEPLTEAEILAAASGLKRSTWQRARDKMLADGELWRGSGFGKTKTAFGHRVTDRSYVPRGTGAGQRASGEEMSLAATDAPDEGEASYVPNRDSTLGRELPGTHVPKRDVPLEADSGHLADGSYVPRELSLLGRELPSFEPLAAEIMASGYPPVPGIAPNGGADEWWCFAENATPDDWARAAEAMGWEPGK